MRYEEKYIAAKNLTPLSHGHIPRKIFPMSILPAAMPFSSVLRFRVRTIMWQQALKNWQ
ncbi:MAG: hypothetical protein Q4D50_12640 [Eubacteriales bacterium]|nr:hypothetical protein [Eubacteriales bacterium]